MTRRYRVLVPALAVAAAALAGCQYPSAQKIRSLNALIGQPETDLIRQYGVPTRTYEVNGHKFLAYDQHHVDYIPGDPGFWGWGWGPYWPGWGGGGFPPEIVDRTCDTTFEVVAGRVQSWSLRGNDCG
jgi:hypothetical protein